MRISTELTMKICYNIIMLVFTINRLSQILGYSNSVVTSLSIPSITFTQEKNDSCVENYLFCGLFLSELGFYYLVQTADTPNFRNKQTKNQFCSENIEARLMEINSSSFLWSSVSLPLVGALHKFFPLALHSTSSFRCSTEILQN